MWAYLYYVYDMYCSMKTKAVFNIQLHSSVNYGLVISVHVAEMWITMKCWKSGQEGKY